VGVIGPLERMGLLFFDRLALSGGPRLRGKGYAIELYRISSRQNNGADSRHPIGGPVYGRLGGIGTTLFALGKPE